jgi:hypothetical protein
MKLTSTDGIILSFHIIGYEHPKITDGIDSNWLNLNIKIKGKGINIDKTDPSLQSSELNELIRWFIKLIIGKLEPNQYWSPLEDTFTFEYGGRKENIYLIRFYPKQKFSPLTPYFQLEFLYSDKELSLLIKSLRKYEKKFPLRDKQTFI